MNVKVCDRCRKEFKVFGNGQMIPVEDIGKLEQKTPPGGLKHVSTLTLPVAFTPEKERTETRLTVMEIDLCAHCVTEFQAVVGKWFAEKKAPATAQKA